jgi:hypothetical protein
MPKAKPKPSKGDWSRVYVLEGEPCLCEFALRSVLGKCKSSQRNFAGEAGSIKTLLTAYNIGRQFVPVFRDPSTEVLKAIETVVLAGTYRTPAIVIVHPDGYADRRLGFYAAAAKEGRLYEYAYFLAAESEPLKKHLANWEKRSGLSISVKAREWLLSNAPTRMANVKAAKGKKQEEVYDIMGLELDLEKVGVLLEAEGRDTVSPEDLQDTVWCHRPDSQWDFCDAVLARDARGVFSYLDSDLQQQKTTEVGVVSVLATQLLFAEKVVTLRELGVTDSDAAAEAMTAGDVGSKYLLPGEEAEPSAKPHPFRVKMVQRKTQPMSAADVRGMRLNTQAARADMLRGAPKDLCLNNLCNSLLSRSPYQPLKAARRPV